MSKLMYPLLLSVLFCAFVPPAKVFAQNEGTDEVEALYDQFDREEPKKTAAPVRRSERPESQPTSLSELKDLAPFSDLAVISRKFLPKTNRFEVSASGVISLNNEFFNNMGATLRGDYYLTEKWGIELMYFFLTDVERDITRKLKENVNIKTESLVVPESYYGVSLKWMPIYGKMALMENRIIPYDMFFLAGVGQSNTALGNAETTVSLGTGQLFALSKSMALRWDVTYNFYQAEVEETDGGVTSSSTSSHSDLFLSVGLSFFFPEAGYR